MSRIVIATTARFDLASGDRYLGEVQAIQGDLITLANYSAWYEGDTTPYDSKDATETVRFRIDHETRVETFPNAQLCATTR